MLPIDGPWDKTFESLSGEKQVFEGGVKFIVTGSGDIAYFGIVVFSRILLVEIPKMIVVVGEVRGKDGIVIAHPRTERFEVHQFTVP